MFTYYVANTMNDTDIRPTSSSPTDSDILKAISDAHAAGMSVALKPHIDSLDGVWRANIGTHFTTEEQWSQWFTSYTAFMLHSAALAAQGNVTGGFNVGTELDGTHGRESQWRAVIAAVRAALPVGVPIWLGPNWEWKGQPGYRQVEFWDALDFLGVDMYAPLSNHVDPTLEEAVAGWAPLIANLSAFYQEQGGKKGFVFAEIGYASYQDAAVNGPGCCVGPSDEGTQNVLYQAFFKAVLPQPWFAGVFWWAWDASFSERVQCSMDFNIYGKLAQATVKAAYAPGSGGVGAAVALPVPASAPPPLILYSNGVTRYDNWSWGGSVNLTSAVDPYPGHSRSCSVSIPSQEYGMVALHSQDPLDLSLYTHLEFDLRAAQSPSAYGLQAWLCACDDCSATGSGCPKLPAVDLDVFAPPATPCSIPFSWDADPGGAKVKIPITDLLGGVAVNTGVKRVQIGGKGPLEFSVDNINFT